jgi:hypothetical protein
MEDVQKQAFEINSNDGNLDANGVEKKQPFLIRTIKKLISWTIAIVICVIVGNYIIGLQEEQKQNFFADAKRQAISDCGGNVECKSKVNKYFDSCIKNNYSSYKKGKYNRKYIFDLDGFKYCIANKE